MEYANKNASILSVKTKNDIKKWLNSIGDEVKNKQICNDDNKKKKFDHIVPLLIRSNLDSFFDVLWNAFEDEGARKNIESTKRRIVENLNFLKNSSIWIRFCDNGDWDGVREETKTTEIKDAIEEFEWFDVLGLYDFKPAKEYIEYQLRAQQGNYLAEIGGHGVHITPMLYSDEVVFRDFFLRKRNVKEAKGDSLGFKFLPDETNVGFQKAADGFQKSDIELRILLLDDKINQSPIHDGMVYECGDCRNCSDKKDCKLRVLRSLLIGEFINNTDKQEIFNNNTYWTNNVKSYVVDTITLSQIMESNDEGESNIGRKVNNRLNGESGNVQIVGVRDIETALALMSCCKFDIILLDYLLGPRSDTDTERTYSTELFEFLGYDFEKKNDSNVVEMLKKSTGFDNDKLREFQNNVKLNRGPLDRFWIIPMTSYNSSFISDLQRKHVRLIDHRWNISQGADPINTPWRFLYKLNEFVDLQLRQSIYWKSQLLTFICFTCEDFKEYIVKRLNDGSCFGEFQQFMGAEYANLMKRYGARKLIERDARNENDEDNKSVFATYISNHFYNEKDETYGIVTELNRLMQDFYHHAATMFDDRYGHKLLREKYERLRLFIAYNNLGDYLTVDKKDKLLHGLQLLRVVIDSEFSRKAIREFIQKS